jgi:hypothetical protein
VVSTRANHRVIGARPPGIKCVMDRCRAEHARLGQRRARTAPIV